MRLLAPELAQVMVRMQPTPPEPLGGCNHSKVWVTLPLQICIAETANKGNCPLPVRFKVIQ
jgi:hypothetical protein